ncbi:hypothetical protein ACHAWU_008858 [Discostella pseudostelligera]|uniref:Uncharacterized protein n=1 Tax=Discostella pseudostelligera TaxID=259834 RepID=A0ABD3N003_9STRA
MGKQLKLRRQPTASDAAALTTTGGCSTLPRENMRLDMVECGSFSSSSDDDSEKKDDDYHHQLGKHHYHRPAHESSEGYYHHHITASSALLRLIPPLSILTLLPFLIWDAHPKDWEFFHLYPLIRHCEMVWSSLLQFSSWPVMICTFLAVAFLHKGSSSHSTTTSHLDVSSSNKENGAPNTMSQSSTLAIFAQSNWKMPFVISIIFSLLVIINMTLQMVCPHSIWNPFIWGWYRVYLPADISKTIESACLHSSSIDSIAATSSSNNIRPLCLSEKQWSDLSSGKFSSYNPEDVSAVERGLDFLQNQSGGLIINALARNVVGSIPALRQNMDGLASLFNQESSHTKLSLVIFENDSNDGTRQAFQSWSEQESSRKDGPRYTVDLMSCGPKNPNCELGIMDRYDKNPFTTPTASGVGKLGEFRQILLEYILGKSEYDSYSHMVILDADLGTSISPLGLLHTLGLESNIAGDYVVASSSGQVWPGTLGTITPPYDFSAFRAKESTGNQKVRQLHQSFCELMPAGDRWRNLCDASSPMQLFMIQSANDATNHHDKPYEVVSAFNGMTLYPMALIRDRGNKARYDSGDDGQRCEHVGFHLSLQETMYVNPKWRMNLKPNKPGGPVGLQAVKTLVYAIFGRPGVVSTLVISKIFFFFIVVSSCWRIGTTMKSLWHSFPLLKNLFMSLSHQICRAGNVRCLFIDVKQGFSMFQVQVKDVYEKV